MRVPTAMLAVVLLAGSALAVPTRLWCDAGYDTQTGAPVTRQFTRLYDSAAECETARRAQWFQCDCWVG